MSRKPGMGNIGNIGPSIGPSKVKKPGFFGDDPDEMETNMYFNNQTAFRSDKEMIQSASPSQLAAFGSSMANLYGQPQSQQPSGMAAAMGSLGLHQRGMSNPPFPRTNPGHVTPTSLAQGFPLGLQQQQASPNRTDSGDAFSNTRNLFATRGILNQIQTSQTGLGSQLKRGNPLTSGLMGSQGSSASIFSRPGDSQVGLDLSEFPSLSNRSAPPNPVPTRSYEHALAAGMVNKPAQEPAPEFQIQQEDFPALPGAQNPPASTASDSTSKTPTSSPGLGSYEQVLRDGAAKFPGDKSGSNQQRRGIQTHPDGTVSNIPMGMVTDQFGMVGLLTFIRAAETDPNLVALAPGIDLTTLGLNLNSPENLYTSFQSPWADSPCRPQDIDFHVPQEYLTNIFIREKLAPIKLNRYGEDLLFFLFYLNGGDVLQLAAAAELYNRDWRYHKDERVWITRVPGLDPQMKTNSFERGTYYFFDATNWRKVAKEFRLEYDKLEERPQLPSTLHHNPNQPVLAH